MLNKLDDILAPNICLYLLVFICSFQIFLLYALSNSIWVYVGFIIFIASIFFCLKVFLARQDRNRVYSIVKNRITKYGYNKTILNGKCANICLLTQATYIAVRFNSCRDFFYFYSEFKKKKTQYVHENEELEHVLNQIDFNKVSAGEVVYEYER